MRNTVMVFNDYIQLINNCIISIQGVLKISKNLSTSDGKQNNAIYKSKEPILMKMYACM